MRFPSGKESRTDPRTPSVFPRACGRTFRCVRRRNLLDDQIDQKIQDPYPGVCTSVAASVGSLDQWIWCSEHATHWEAQKKPAASFELFPPFFACAGCLDLEARPPSSKLRARSSKAEALPVLSDVHSHNIVRRQGKVKVAYVMHYDARFQHTFLSIGGVSRNFLGLPWPRPPPPYASDSDSFYPTAHRSPFPPLLSSHTKLSSHNTIFLYSTTPACHHTSASSKTAGSITSVDINQLAPLPPR